MPATNDHPAATFQDVILRLQQYWADKGCLIWQPYDIECGAGTFNPATFLRTLGPEPWRVAYVEPSRRPTDGRYGENPNRLGHYYQFQVILKPAPEDAQEAYLGSLRALGIDLVKHDLRFVEDDWEQPSVGAAGLGWEVWLDGMEASQYTYFQKVGGIEVDTVCVEYTYGLERLAMFLQGVDNVYDLVWVDGPNGPVTYGDVHLQDEKQFSAFHFEHADIASHLKWFDEYEAQAQKLLEADLVGPAYDFVLKASHTFNVLDARNAVGVAQRAMYIGRCRTLAQQVAEKFLAHRKALGFPLIKGELREKLGIPDPEPESEKPAGEQTEQKPATVETAPTAPQAEPTAEEKPAQTVAAEVPTEETPRPSSESQRRRKSRRQAKVVDTKPKKPRPKRH